MQDSKVKNRKGGRVQAAKGSLRFVLEARAAMDAAVRAWFDGEGFLQVATPAAVPHPNLDPNVRPVPVRVHDFDGELLPLWLHTSPELSMKRLLAKGSGSIYQICPVFRDGERTRRHRQEFSMLEWYRVGADYRDAMRDTAEVFRAAARAVAGEERARFAGKAYDLAGPWEEITMAEAFRRFAGAGSWDPGELREALGGSGHIAGPGASVQDLFFHLYVGKVEPELGREGPVIVKDFPDFLGTMARPAPGDPRILERFEVYIGGLELANGYSELADARELSLRMEEAIRGLEKEGAEGLTVDGAFLQAMADMPACAGVSVGMDRLAMVLMDAEDISRVIYPFEEETV